MYQEMDIKETKSKNLNNIDTDFFKFDGDERFDPNKKEEKKGDKPQL